MVPMERILFIYRSIIYETALRHREAVSRSYSSHAEPPMFLRALGLNNAPAAIPQVRATYPQQMAYISLPVKGI
jgi:hypothetical protein